MKRYDIGIKFGPVRVLVRDFTHISEDVDIASRLDVFTFSFPDSGDVEISIPWGESDALKAEITKLLGGQHAKGK